MGDLNYRRCNMPKVGLSESGGFGCYNAAVFRTLLAAGWLLVGSVCSAQDPNPAQKTPPVKVNVLNVCTPSEEEQHQIAAALSSIPEHPSFNPDFEVSHGRSVLDPASNPLLAAGTGVPGGEIAIADFVRVRHDLAGKSLFGTVQYSFSRDNKQMVETLVLRVRDPKDLLQLSLEDNASSVTTATAMLNSATPVTRIKLERFGKSSVVLARCSSMETGQPVDQSKYEPLFASATRTVSAYRNMLGVRTRVPEELAQIARDSAQGGHSPRKPGVKSGTGKH